MAEQRELPLTLPELAPEAPLIPVRMANKYVYCPRLACLEWVQGEFRHMCLGLIEAIIPGLNRVFSALFEVN